jgi:hypothetical protein
MKYLVTRDSVAMGDDIYAPHEKRFSFPDNLSVEEVIEQISHSNYLAKIQGGKATWSVVSGYPLVVLAQEWDVPKPIDWQPLEVERLKKEAGEVILHFNYHAQIEPSIVLDVLQQAKLHEL